MGGVAFPTSRASPFFRRGAARFFGILLVLGLSAVRFIATFL
jgi:hypothetical protein